MNENKQEVKMKKLLLAAALLPLIGCATIPQGSAPSSSPLINQRGEDLKYEVIGTSSASSGSFSLFGFIPFGRADIDEAISDAIKSRGGDNIINLSYNVESVYYLFFGITTSIKVEGDVIKYKSGSTNSDVLNSEFKTGPLSSKLPVGHQLSVNIFSDGTGINYNLIMPFSKIIFGKLSVGYRAYEEKETETAYYFGETKYSFIPITFSAGINTENLIQTGIPLNGFASAGVGYYPDMERTDHSGSLKNMGWLNFGWNLGVGVEYKLIPQLALGIDYNYHSMFIGENKTEYQYFFIEPDEEKPSYSDFGLFLKFIP